jgi:hypothetical protein
MPPKVTDAGVAEVTKDANFLAACFMGLKTKPVVDCAVVADKMSMSAGGARWVSAYCALLHRLLKFTKGTNFAQS